MERNITREIKIVRENEEMKEKAKDDLFLGREIIGLYEKILLRGKENSIKVWAKVDTGADSSSIDARLVSKLGSSPIIGSKVVRNTHGSSVRVITVIPTIVRGREVKIKYNISDRSKMKYYVLLGRNFLNKYKGLYLIDPYTKEPKEKERKKIWVVSNV